MLFYLSQLMFTFNAIVYMQPDSKAIHVSDDDEEKRSEMRKKTEAPGAAIIGAVKFMPVLFIIGFVVITDIPRLVADVKRFMIPSIRSRMKGTCR